MKELEYGRTISTRRCEGAKRGTDMECLPAGLPGGVFTIRRMKAGRGLRSGWTEIARIKASQTEVERVDRFERNTGVLSLRQAQGQNDNSLFPLRRKY